MSTNFWVAQRPLFTEAMSLYPRTKALEDLFTYESRFEEQVVLWVPDKDPSLMWVPRSVCPVAENSAMSAGEPISVGSKIVPRSEEHKRVSQEAFHLLEKGNSFVLRARPGFGKTVIGLDLFCRLQRTTLVVVPKQDLVQQWRERILEFTDCQESDIGLVQQDVCEYQDKKIVVAMLHSLAKDDGRYPTDFYKHFGFVVFDEVHTMPATTFSVVGGLFSAELRLGLSATPERVDGKDRTTEAHIGPILVTTEMGTMTPVVGCYESPWSVPTVDGYNPVYYTAGKTMHIEKSMAYDAARNELLMRLIMTAYRKQRRTVIFSSLVEHLETLQQRAIASGADPKDTALYVNKSVGKGKKKEKERERAKGCRLIFATYGMMGMGTDIPWLDCCILATPRAHIKQAAGRVLREYPGKPTPAILDIVDDDGGIFSGYAYSRQKFYRDIGAKIVRY